MFGLEKGAVIDFHTHTFPDAVAGPAIAKMEQLMYRKSGILFHAKLKGTRADLIRSVKENNIALSVILPVATNPGQPESINHFAMKNNEETGQTGLLSFGAVHPDNENFREILNGLRDNGFKGIKLHPDYQGTVFDDIRYMRIIDYAESLGLITVTHAGHDPGFPEKVHCTPDMVLRVMEEVKPQHLVLAHMGGMGMWKEVEQKLCGLPLYMDTANCFEDDAEHLSKEDFESMVLRHGADRILFATDSPWTDQGLNAERIRKTGLTQKQQDMILGENACRLLGINLF